MSIFRGAEKVVVHGGQFSVNNQPVNTVIRAENTADVVSILRRHSAAAGLLNARERFDAPKCDEDTRISMIRRMKNWVQSGDQTRSSMFWLHGPAGVGKSALGQSLALALQGEQNHAASFFFSRTSPGRNNGAQLVATLACQLAVQIPRIRLFISKSIAENPFIFESSNELQMEKLIIEPVNELQASTQRWWTWFTRITRLVLRPGRGRSANSRHNITRGLSIPRLILVDGLDECENPDVQRDLILCLGHAARDMRLPFRIIVASRPESHILSTFKMDRLFTPPRGMVVSNLNLGGNLEADQSITIFLRKEFAKIRRTHPLRDYLPDPWPKPEDINHLVHKSSKTFIYPTTVIRYIRLPNNRPEECLNRILGMSEIPSFERPYEMLDNLYHHIFQSLKDSIWPYITALLQPLLKSHWLLDYLETSSPSMSERVAQEHILMFIPIFLPPELEPLVIEEDVGRKHAQLTILWIKGMFSTDSWIDANNTMVRTMCLHLVEFSLSQASYYPPLVVFLEAIDNYATQLSSRLGKEDMQRMKVLGYLQRVEIYPWKFEI